MLTMLRNVCLLVVMTLIAALSPATDAKAQRVERVVSPAGIEAWLVRETANPLVAMEFAFQGGAAQDPADKGGVATLVAGTLDEGAGPFDARAFQERLERLAAQLSFRASRDHLTGSFRTLNVNRDAAFAMVAEALNRPRFEGADLDRIRQSIAAQLRREESEPNALASRALVASLFPGHPYGRPQRGTLESIAAITPDDLKAYHRRVVARDGLNIAVVGDIDPETLGRLLDQTFAGLPARADLAPVPRIAPQDLGARRILPLDLPQTVIQFATAGLDRHDPDFIPAFVMNHVLGGGSFTSRLWTEVRETRGLTYGIGTGLATFDAAALFTGQTSTRNESAAEALALIESEIRRMAADGPTEEELDKAKSFLIGSYLLRFDTSQRIAQQLLSIQLDRLGIDWIDRRNAVVAAVSHEDVRRAARRVLSGAFTSVLVGRPAGVSERAPGG